MATKNIDLLKDIPPDSKGDGGSKNDQIENIAIDKEIFISDKAEEPSLEENLPENIYLTPIQRGQHLAIQFREHNIHPILIFGASKSFHKWAKNVEKTLPLEEREEFSDQMDFVYENFVSKIEKYMFLVVSLSADTSFESLCTIFEILSSRVSSRSPE